MGEQHFQELTWIRKEEGLVLKKETGWLTSYYNGGCLEKKWSPLKYHQRSASLIKKRDIVLWIRSQWGIVKIWWLFRGLKLCNNCDNAHIDTHFSGSVRILFEAAIIENKNSRKRRNLSGKTLRNVLELVQKRELVYF